MLCQAVRILARWLSAFAEESSMGVLRLLQDQDAIALDGELDEERAHRRRLSQLARAGASLTDADAGSG